MLPFILKLVCVSEVVGTQNLSAEAGWQVCPSWLRMGRSGHDATSRVCELKVVHAGELICMKIQSREVG